MDHLNNEELAYSLYAPSWTENSGTENNAADDFPSPPENSSGTPEAKMSCLLEGFSEDVSALIISHLDLQEIANLSYVSKSLYKACRSNTLWKNLMNYRWNLQQEEDMYQDCFVAYKQAHAHPHDLWLSHWNIVYPADALSPGRCCIPAEETELSRSSTNRAVRSKSSKPWKCCPTCRNWKDYEDENNQQNIPVAKTAAQAMAQATCCTRRKCLHPPEKLTQKYAAAREAFACAGTFHRKIKTNQYNAGTTNFLTDLLFFNLTDPSTEEGQWELGQILREAQEQQEHEEAMRGNQEHHESFTDPLHETSHHSWHICRLLNPDFYRPIIFQAGIQRPVCFTVFPSEGYIQPGGSMYLTIGIRPLGSALAYAFDALNVQRDGLDLDWADLYTTQAHLPMAPILVRYQYAATHPNAADSMYDPRRRPPHYIEQEERRRRNGEKSQIGADKEALLGYHWRQPVASHHVRSIHLSVHAHSHYAYSDFAKATCLPWNSFAQNYKSPMFVAPNLSEFYQHLHQRLENLPQPPFPSRQEQSINPFHTEEPCLECGQPWGLREEELALAYIMSWGEVLYQQHRRLVLLQNILHCIRLVVSDEGLTGQGGQLSLLLVAVNRILQCFKAAPWANLQQRRKLIQLEAIVDDAYRQIPSGGENWTPWRLAGVYRFAVCTDSVFQGDALEQDDMDADFKDEPDYLDAFRHLAHSPGYYCLGPQEDPNHLGETIVPSSPRYTRIQKGIATDVFMDDPISAFQAGICMMRDARSLLVHGIYDRMPYPGAVVRRPKLISTTSACLSTKQRSSLKQEGCNDDRRSIFSTSKARQWYCLLQNSLDVDAMQTIEEKLGCAKDVVLPDFLHLSFENYLRGVPPPGVGRFPISQEAGVEDTTMANEFHQLPILPVSLDENDTPTQTNSSNPEARRAAGWNQPPFLPNRAPPVGNARGLRLIHLLWALGARLGLAVIDSPDVASVFVDRTILIASQWVSISLMLAPLFWTLCARYVHLIPAQPVDYNLEDLPFHLSNKMRFLTEEECGYVACLVFFVWLALGRWTERNVSRDFFRVMLDHINPQAVPNEDRKTRLGRFRERLFLRYKKRWDLICPLFLQRRVFAPDWNRRTTDDLMRHIAFWRSRNVVEQRSAARPVERRSNRMFGDSRDEGCDFGNDDCTTTKLVVGAVVALGSFCSSSPHFWLNLVTVFSCSISLGMSVSLHSMEKGRSSVNISSTGSMIKAASLATVVITAFLIGQLVGSSGGTMFLAEFIVTSISLILGGAGTISASAMESWACFFCLSSTAFWGYLFGRVALMDGVRQKRGGYSSMLLSNSVIFLFLFWILVFLVSTWDSSVSLLIVKPTFSDDGRFVDRKDAAKLLQ